LWKEISAEAIAHGWVERRDVREDGTVNPESARWGQLFLRLVCAYTFLMIYYGLGMVRGNGGRRGRYGEDIGRLPGLWYDLKEQRANIVTGGDSISFSVSGLKISTCTIPTSGTQVVEESGCGIFVVSHFTKPNSNG